ncbi:MAG: hypothetical protein C4524_07825 [Candidatus Zixiibacteriota bacterium]|nr:MAG: hypothetical protein C4524_07825 [candidate division Zixibacteria bacterium]
MEKLNLLKAVAAELEMENPRGLARYLSDDFVYSGAIPEPLSKHQYIEFMAAIKQALPDWSYAIEAIKDLGHNVIRLLVQPQGTHMGDLILPGMEPISATGARLVLPHEIVDYTFKDHKILEIVSWTSSGGGFSGLLTQLGADLTRIFWSMLGLPQTERETRERAPAREAVLA